MLLLAIAGAPIRDWARRVILAFAQRTAASGRDVPPEFYRFPLF
jgi:hypothetical protein